MPRNPDVLVVGGGIIGAAIACRLAKDGASVTLLDRGTAGREASWAAGGILAPIHLADYPAPLAALCAASIRLYEPLVRELRGLSPTDPELRTTGMLILVDGPEGEAEARKVVDWKRRNGQPVERLSREEARAREPALAPDLGGALLLPDIAQVRNNRMTRALLEAAERRGVQLLPDTPVTGFLHVPRRVNGVRTPRGDFYAAVTVLAAGAWSPEILRPLGIDLPVKPIKGQMLLTEAEPGFLRHMILEGESYLVPRADGKILIGSTLEDAGFDKTVTLDAAGHLASRAARLVPALARLPLARSWAGLRPSTPDRLPYIGRAPAEGLVVATGHFRNGILLAPITAELVADLVAGRPPSIPLEPFSPSRASSPAPL
jgi:glycine oxidase